MSSLDNNKKMRHIHLIVGNQSHHHQQQQQQRKHLIFRLDFNFKWSHNNCRAIVDRIVRKKRKRQNYRPCDIL